MTLTLQPTGLSSPIDRDRADYVVFEDGRAIGRIYEDRATLPKLRWFWPITLYVDPKRGDHHERTRRDGAIRRGVGGAKGRDRGECAPTKHAPDSEPGKRDTGCWLAYGKSLPLIPEVGAVCGKAARTDLCGGREVTRVPTAKICLQMGDNSVPRRYTMIVPSSNATMSARMRIVEEHVTRENEHNLDGIMDTFGETARYDDEAWGAHYQGRQEVRKFYAEMLQARLAP